MKGKIAGYEAHHIPAKSASPLSIGEGPSIAMQAPDHRMTASAINSPAGRAYRQEQAVAIAEGDWQRAIDMDIADIRSKFGTKYDGAIEQMKDYARSIGIYQ